LIVFVAVWLCNALVLRETGCATASRQSHAIVYRATHARYSIVYVAIRRRSITPLVVNSERGTCASNAAVYYESGGWKPADSGLSVVDVYLNVSTGAYRVVALDAANHVSLCACVCVCVVCRAAADCAIFARPSLSRSLAHPRHRRPHHIATHCYFPHSLPLSSIVTDYCR
jgi:hypothetical protein